MKKAPFYILASVFLLFASAAVSFALTKETQKSYKPKVTTYYAPFVNKVASGTTIATVPPSTTIKAAAYFSVEKIKANPSNLIFFNVPVVKESVDMALAMLSENNSPTIYLVLDSPGGSVVDGARLIEYIKNSGKNIVTVCDNFCASMAFQIFQAGKRRILTEKAILMAHPASGSAKGTIENMYELVKMFKLYVDRMDADTAKRAGIDYNTFKALVSNNIWLEAPDALALKLADGIGHVEFKDSLFGTNKPLDVLENLKRTNKFNPEMLAVKGYVFNF